MNERKERGYALGRLFTEARLRYHTLPGVRLERVPLSQAEAARLAGVSRNKLRYLEGCPVNGVLSPAAMRLTELYGLSWERVLEVAGIKRPGKKTPSAVYQENAFHAGS